MLALLVALLTIPAGAAAQEPSAADVALARRQFEEGMAAARASRWDAAREAFERSYTLVRRPRILANLATAQAQTGRLVEAAESYRQFLREVSSGPDAATRPGVQHELAALEPRIPEVRITIEGLRPQDRVTLDGAEVSRAALGVPVPINPGSHRLVVTRGSAELESEPFSVAESEHRELNLELPVRAPLPAPGRDVPRVREPDRLEPEPEPEDEVGASDEGGGVLSSPIFWVVVGLVVAGGVTGGVLIATGESDPPAGNFGMGRWTID